MTERSARPHAVQLPRKSKVDKDLKRIVALETATLTTAQHFAGLGLAFLFLLTILILTTLHTWGVENSYFVVIAAVIGGYMALNIGANDVANNVGPAVGARALTMTGALAIAAIFEAGGAIIAGGEVVNTVSRGIVDPTRLADTESFILAMTAALLAGAVWINLATWIGAPVSTTHSVVGGVLGAGVAAAGLQAVNWGVVGGIVASWVVSPVLGGGIAALFYYAINVLILRRPDKIMAARRWVPALVALMAAAFTVYLVNKGLSRVWRPSTAVVGLMGLGTFALTFFIMQPLVERRSRTLENRRKSINELFTVPLICSAALLSFAHGANDVANAVGPLAAVVGAVGSGTVEMRVAVPLWVMVVGAIGISAGLVLFGPKVIRIVGQRITRLDPMRAFCIALSAAITVIVASALGLPVSSTHIAVGGIFGVGFLREAMANRKRRARAADPNSETDDTLVLVDDLLTRKLEKAQKRRLVRRVHLLGIAAAWVVTVPMSAVIAGGLYGLGLLMVPG